MRKGPIYFAAITVAVVGGFVGGRAFRHRDTGESGAAATAPAGGPSDGVERKRIPLVGLPRGAPVAPVTIVEFSDFQCPYCGRVTPTVDELFKAYPGRLRIYFRHFPLPFHPDAPLAWEAALAADAQGKFWEMHDKLFANQQAIKRPDLERYAQELGLDMAKFKQALDAGTYKARIEEDKALGSGVGVNGTPAFFINGRSLVGAVPIGEFKKIIDEELATAQKLVASGTPMPRVYDTLMARAGQPGAAGAAAPAAPPRPVVGTEVYRVPVGKAPVRGAKQPKVTLVEYSDFQCPYCGRVVATLDRVLKEHPSDVALAFKEFPLPSLHPHAVAAAMAAVAAQ